MQPPVGVLMIYIQLEAKIGRFQTHSIGCCHLYSIKSKLAKGSNQIKHLGVVIIERLRQRLKPQ